MSDRAGTYRTGGTYRTFDPRPLPPHPPLLVDRGLQNLLSKADRAIARLDGASMTLPNPDLFVYAFMRKEAELSSRIEGTQASLDDLFEFEAQAKARRTDSDVGDIVNYIDALNHGIDSLNELPLSLRLIREMHRRLLSSGRGSNRDPGEFRSGQNHIGPPGCTIDEAVFVPPAVSSMTSALAKWEAFLHDDDLPVLVRCALVHAQFETIHPFWDGNGRIGRMVVILMLCAEGILERPLLYLSLYFSRYKSEYYTRLQAVRDEGDWEGWVAFFLRGVHVTCRSALDTAQKINALRERTLAIAHASGQSANNARLAEALFMTPYVSVSQASRILDSSNQTGMNVIRRLCDANILVPSGNGSRDRLYVFQSYVSLLETRSLDLATFP